MASNKDNMEKAILGRKIGLNLTGGATRDKWNLIWRGCKVRGWKVQDGLGHSDDIVSDTRCEQGVEVLNDLDAIDTYISQKSVEYGEESGGFHALGAWRGTFNDLKNGKSRFYGSKELLDEISSNDY